MIYFWVEATTPFEEFVCFFVRASQRGKEKERWRRRSLGKESSHGVENSRLRLINERSSYIRLS